MAIKLNKNESLQRRFYEICSEFRMDVDAAYALPGEPFFEGYKMVSRPRGVLDVDYRPLSRLEKILDRMGLGHNQNDEAFTLEKDGVQGLVFCHCGQYFLSDWFLDVGSRKAEFVQYPALKSATAKELWYLATLCVTGECGQVTDYSKAKALNLIDGVSSMPLVGEGTDAVIRDTALRWFYMMDSQSLDAMERSCLERRLVVKALSAPDGRLGMDELLMAIADTRYYAESIKETVEASRKPGYWGPSVFTQGIDLDVPSWNAVKGLRFAEHAGERLCYVLLKDQKALRLSSLSRNSLLSLYASLNSHGMVGKAVRKAPAREQKRLRRNAL